MSVKKRFKLKKLSFLILLTSSASSAFAQENAAPKLEETTVTGYRGSLLNSTNAKKDSVGFSDEVFSDEIGKMPSQNLAESLSRIPGVKISREVTGEGQQITVRGLGSSFTKVVMNGNSISVASDGSLGSGQRGRHVDLDMFPPELFTSLSVNKTTTADQVEGGVAGYVNMRTIRPSDMGDGSNFRFGVEGAYNETAGSTNPRYSLMYGNSGERFGVLVGLVGRQNETRVDGFETIGGYADGCAVEVQPIDAELAPNGYACLPGSSAGNTFYYPTYATADYAGAHNLNTGDAIDINAVSGLNSAQLDTMKLPYIIRPMYTLGDRDTVSGILALEFNVNEDLSMNLDVLHSKADRNFLRNEASMIYRRNYPQYGQEWLPENITLSETGVVDQGTFWNNRPWIGTRDYQEDLTYTSVMPHVKWQMTDILSMDVGISHTQSEFDRDEPYVLFYGPAGQVSLDYSTEFPTLLHTTDTTNPNDNWTWTAGPSDIPGIAEATQGITFRFQRNARDTETNTMKVDFALGEDPSANGFKFGLAFDEIESNMTGFNSDGFSELLEGSDLELNFADYLVKSPVTDFGNSIDNYRGINGIVSLDWDRAKKAIGYNSFEPGTGGSGDQFGQKIGNINEKIMAAYLEANVESEIADRVLRTNMGVRLVDTNQTVATEDTSTKADYKRLLPSFSAVYDLTSDIKLRTGASRSLTRANPSSMFPTVAWNGSGIDEVASGNPYLSPFESTNFDIGGEWYFDELGYVGLTYYTKDITGFTRRSDVTVQFAELTDYGVDTTDDGLSDLQLAAIQACGGKTSANCTTRVVTDVNIDGTTRLSGFEVIWVMPLDMWVDGLGFNTSFNKIKQDASDPSAEITGISDSLNFTAYYENDIVQTRLTFSRTGDTANDGGSVDQYSDARSQVDLSASYKLPVLEDYNLSLTFDAYNLTKEPMRSYFASDNNTYNITYPGAVYTFGIRGSF